MKHRKKIRVFVDNKCDVFFCFCGFFFCLFSCLLFCLFLFFVSYFGFPICFIFFCEKNFFVIYVNDGKDKSSFHFYICLMICRLRRLRAESNVLSSLITSSCFLIYHFGTDLSNIECSTSI